MNTFLRVLVAVLFTSFPSVLWAQTAPSGGIDARIEAITKCKDLGDTKKIAQCAADAAKGAYDLSRDEINLLRLALANLERELAKKASKSELGVLTNTVSGLDQRTTTLEKLVGTRTSTDTKTLVYRVTKLETRSSTVTVGEFPFALDAMGGIQYGTDLGYYLVAQIEVDFNLLRLFDGGIVPHAAIALGWGGEFGKGMFSPKGGVMVRLYPLFWHADAKSEHAFGLLVRGQYSAYDRRTNIPGAGVEASGIELGIRYGLSKSFVADLTFSPASATFAPEDGKQIDPRTIALWTIMAGMKF